MYSWAFKHLKKYVCSRCGEAAKSRCERAVMEMGKHKQDSLQSEQHVERNGAIAAQQKKNTVLAIAAVFGE